MFDVELPMWLLTGYRECKGQKIANDLHHEDWLTNPADAEEGDWIVWSHGVNAKINEIEVNENGDVYHYCGADLGNSESISPSEIRRNPNVVVV